ncbi:hypothetical protein ABT072_47610, partial [Streptomyces sp. NPDC002589]
MVDPEVLERIAVRCAELDSLEEQLVKQLDQVPGRFSGVRPRVRSLGRGGGGRGASDAIGMQGS